VTLSTQPGLFFWAQEGWPLADRRGLQQGCDLFEDSLHAHAGIYSGVNFVMVSAGVHDQDFRSLVGFLHHVGQVMAIVLGQGGAEDDQVKGVVTESFLNGLAALGGGDVMPSLFHFGGLRRESLFI
jgi:hypothetical protein